MLIKVDKWCKALGVGQRAQRDVAGLKRTALPRNRKAYPFLYLCFQRGNILSETEQISHKFYHEVIEPSHRFCQVEKKQMETSGSHGISSVRSEVVRTSLELVQKMTNERGSFRFPFTRLYEQLHLSSLHPIL